MKYRAISLCAVIGLLVHTTVLLAMQTQRLTDTSVEKPCIIVSGDGSHIAWIEQAQKPAPENTVYTVRTSGIENAAIEDVLLLPGISSNQRAHVLVGGKSTALAGPKANPSDLNYRVIAVSPQVRLSRNGKMLAACAVEIFQTVKRNPFFILIDLEQKSYKLMPVLVPEHLGSIVDDPITSSFNPMYWDLSPDGAQLAYVIDSANYRGSTAILLDIATQQARRVIGYEKAYFDKGSLTIEGPEDQKTLYGWNLCLGDNALVVIGRDSQRRDGLWIAPVDGGTPVWHETRNAIPGMAGGHVYYRSQNPGTWLDATGKQQTSFKQQIGLDNHGALPFHAGAPGAYVLDQKHERLLQLGAGDPQNVLRTADLGLPQQWDIRLNVISSAGSYRLVSENGGTIILPAHDPQNSDRMDLFVVKREVTASTVVAQKPGDSESSFESSTMQFEVGSLLKPGELNPSWLDNGSSARPSTAEGPSGVEPPELPDLPTLFNIEGDLPPVLGTFDSQLSGGLSDSAEGAHAYAQMLLMTTENLTQADLAPVIWQLEKAVYLAPKNRQYRLDLAEGYLLANTMLSVSEAIGQYSLLLRDDKTDDEALAGMADAYIQLGNIEQAFEVAYLRTQQNPDDPLIRFSAAQQISMFAIETGDVTGGLMYLLGIYENHPTDSAVEGLIGVVRQLQGENERAEAIFDKIIKTHPASDPIVRMAEQIKKELQARRSEQ